MHIHSKLWTRAMSFFLAVLMSFTLLMPETFANSSDDYDNSGEESVVTVDGTDADVDVSTDTDASADEEDYGIQTLGMPYKSGSNIYHNVTHYTAPADLPSMVTVSDDAKFSITQQYCLGRIVEPDVKVNDTSNCKQDVHSTNFYSDGDCIDIRVQDIKNGWTLTNPCTFEYPNVGKIGDEVIGATINIDKIVVGPQETNTTVCAAVNNDDWITVMYFNNFQPELISFGSQGGIGYSGEVDVYYTITMKWMENGNGHKAGDTIDLPFAQSVCDMEEHRTAGNNNDQYDSLYMIESSTFNDDEVLQYYLYTTYYLNVTSKATSDSKHPTQTTFAAVAASGESLERTDGAESWDISGCIAATKTGTWSADTTTGGGYGDGLFVYTYFYNVDEPVKTVVNQKTTYAPGDTVTYQVTEAFPKADVEIFSTLDSWVFTDTLPEGLTYVNNSAKLVDNSTGSTISGSANYNSSTRVLTYTLPDSFLSNSDNYKGQDLVLTFDATVDTDIGLGTQTLTNSVYTTIDGIDFGPSTKDITVKADMTIDKTVSTDGSTYLNEVSIDKSETQADVYYKIVLTPEADIYDLTVVDTYPEQFTVNSDGVSCSDSTCQVTVDSDNHTVTIASDHVKYNGELVIILTGKFDVSAGGLYSNNVTSTDKSGKELRDTADILVNGGLAVKKEVVDKKDAYEVGDTVIFKITATNDKYSLAYNDSYNISFHDYVPAGLEITNAYYEDGSVMCFASTNTSSFPYGRITINDELSICPFVKGSASDGYSYDNMIDLYKTGIDEWCKETKYSTSYWKTTSSSLWNSIADHITISSDKRSVDATLKYASYSDTYSLVPYGSVTLIIECEVVNNDNTTLINGGENNNVTDSTSKTFTWSSSRGSIAYVSYFEADSTNNSIQREYNHDMVDASISIVPTPVTERQTK